MNVMGLMTWTRRLMKKLRNCWRMKSLTRFYQENWKNQSDQEYCSNEESGSDSESPIWRIDSPNTPYLVMQGTTNGDDVKCEHLCLASANEIGEKKPVSRDFIRSDGHSIFLSLV
nr:hypothetical protein [Tanacetum cinerariifolium]